MKSISPLFRSPPRARKKETEIGYNEFICETRLYTDIRANLSPGNDKLHAYMFAGSFFFFFFVFVEQSTLLERARPDVVDSQGYNIASPEWDGWYIAWEVSGD